MVVFLSKLTVNDVRLKKRGKNGYITLSVVWVSGNGITTTSQVLTQSYVELYCRNKNRRFAR